MPVACACMNGRLQFRKSRQALALLLPPYRVMSTGAQAKCTTGSLALAAVYGCAVPVACFPIFVGSQEARGLPYTLSICPFCILQIMPPCQLPHRSHARSLYSVSRRPASSCSMSSDVSKVADVVRHQGRLPKSSFVVYTGPKNSPGKQRSPESQARAMEERVLGEKVRP